MIDAASVAEQAGLDRRINTVMQVCFFALADILPRDEAIAHIKESIRQTWGRRGPEVVRRNVEAVDSALDNLHEVPVPGSVTATRTRPPRVPEHAPDFVQAGAGAVVMHSLFEEQLVAEQMAAHKFIDSRINMDAEARSFFPESEIFEMGSGSYLQRLQQLKTELGVPVIRSVVEQVSVPVSVKLSPFYSALPAFVAGVEAAGARGLVLFNRFYQPDIDLEQLALSREVVLSTSAELPLRLHAMARLYNRTGLDMAASGGVHTGDDAAKAILSGATVVQLVSTVLQHGPAAFERLGGELTTRLASIGYQSLQEARGALSLDNVPDAGTWERLNYARLLHGWQSSR
ncbi:MAG: 2-oxoacid:acceptor oxidoreductase family protein [Alteromonadaceae bacterium]|nr:2-oxoacid:acceptor oxidoreductase family protein [Marinobacter sp.]MDX5387971.1 2-oxoacid:acceptor oxidoreductase family protein [Marinobacter sp.]MDX5439238.1 2-oxoacid:acceptor oxidoreductase family protein [Alteromonadaceae bacterium]